MKRIRLIISFFLLGFSAIVSGQSITLQSEPVMSCFISDWEAHQSLQAQVQASQLTYYRVKIYLYDNLGVTVFESDSTVPVDSLLPGKNTLYWDRLAFIEACVFDDSLAENLFQSGRLEGGSYTFKVGLYDTMMTNLLFGFDSLTFDVDGSMAPALVTPYNAARIYTSVIKLVNFEWYGVDPAPSGSVIYNFQVKEVNPFQSEDSAWDFNSPVISVNVVDSLNLVLPSQLADLLSTNSRYVWGVLSYDFKTGLPIGSYQGNSDYFWFELTNEPNDIYVLQRQLRSGTCEPSDFDDSTFTGWEAFTGENLSYWRLGQTYNKSAFIPWKHTITNPGLDRYGDFPMVCPGGGGHSVMLGTDTTQINTGPTFKMTFRYTVKPENFTFKMSYAVVLNEGDHRRGVEPFFRYRFFRGRRSNLWDFFDEHKYIADTQDPFFKISPHNSKVVYKDWNCAHYDLTKRKGQSIAFEAVAAHCGLAAHWGYGYIDFCTEMNAQAAVTADSEYCYSEPVIISGSACQYEDSYFLSVEESDAQGNRIPGKEVMSWFVGSQAPDSIDLKSFIATYGPSDETKHFKCNTYYRVKIAVVNECSQWNEAVKVIKIVCPGQGLAGPDKCCDPAPLLGLPQKPGFSYQWTPQAYLTAPFSAQTSFTGGNAVTYPYTCVLKTVDPTGCITYDTVVIYCGQPTVQIVNHQSTCRKKLYADYTNANEVTWKVSNYRRNGSIDVSFYTGDSVLLDPDIKIFIEITASNPCGFRTDTLTIFPLNYSSIGNLWIFTKGLCQWHADTLYTPVRFWNFLLPDSALNAYNAVAWRLTYLYRPPDKSDGIWMVVAQGENLNGMYNGEIEWNGQYMGKHFVFTGNSEYSQIRLELKACIGNEWEIVQYFVKPGAECAKRTWFANWRKKKCRRYMPPYFQGYPQNYIDLEINY